MPDRNTILKFKIIYKNYTDDQYNMTIVGLNRLVFYFFYCHKSIFI